MSYHVVYFWEVKNHQVIRWDTTQYLCVCVPNVSSCLSHDVTLLQQWPGSTGLGFKPLQAEPVAPLRAASGWTPVVARLPKFQINWFSRDQLLKIVDDFLSFFIWSWYLEQIDLHESQIIHHCDHHDVSRRGPLWKLGHWWQLVLGAWTASSEILPQGWDHVLRIWWEHGIYIILLCYVVCIRFSLINFMHSKSFDTMRAFKSDCM